MAKGVGAELHIDWTGAGTDYENVGCMYEIKPPGKNRGVQDGEACIGDAIAVQDTGDLTFSELEFLLQANATSDASGIGDKIDAAITADTVVNWAIKWPQSTAIYQDGKGKFSNFDNETWQRDLQNKHPVSILPTEDWTWGATPPPTIP